MLTRTLEEAFIRRSHVLQLRYGICYDLERYSGRIVNGTGTAVTGIALLYFSHTKHVRASTCISDASCGPEFVNCRLKLGKHAKLIPIDVHACIGDGHILLALLGFCSSVVLLSFPIFILPALSDGLKADGFNTNVCCSITKLKVIMLLLNVGFQESVR